MRINYEWLKKNVRQSLSDDSSLPLYEELDEDVKTKINNKILKTYREINHIYSICINKDEYKELLYCLYDLCSQFRLDTPKCLIYTLDDIRYEEQEESMYDWDDEDDIEDDKLGDD